MKNGFRFLLRAGVILVSVACLSVEGAALNACDLNADGTVNKSDVDLAVSMSTGAVTPCSANVIGQGICNVVMVQRVINAALGANCGRTATLTWTASSSAGVSGYKIYRSTVSGGSYVLLSAAPVSGTRYVDNTVQGGKTYYYVVSAVGTTGSESAYSSQVTAVVPSL